MSSSPEARPSEPEHDRFRIIERLAGFQAEIAHAQTLLSDLSLEMGHMIRNLAQPPASEPLYFGVDFGSEAMAWVWRQGDRSGTWTFHPFGPTQDQAGEAEVPETEQATTVPRVEEGVDAPGDPAPEPDWRPVGAGRTLGDPFPGDVPNYVVLDGITVVSAFGEMQVSRPVGSALHLMRDGRFRGATEICSAAQIPHTEALARSFETVRPALSKLGIDLVEGRKDLWAVRKVAS